MRRLGLDLVRAICCGLSPKLLGGGPVSVKLPLIVRIVT
jgi:hypothetical protein